MGAGNEQLTKELTTMGFDPTKVRKVMVLNPKTREEAIDLMLNVG